MRKTICLLNDSFPPQIDGVANTVLNYARCLEPSGYQPIVITPSYPEAEDAFSFQIVRYPSVPVPKVDGYMAGIPFSPETVRKIQNQNVQLLHSHCPIVSTMMARQLRQILDVPLILTYHTKFDIDIANVVSSHRLQAVCKKALTENITACDEVWAVSREAGENLRTLGYEGEYIIMPNGADIPRGRVEDSQIQAATGQYDLPQDVPCYLFVGRLMWYKGIRIILDALTRLKQRGKAFRMVFVGDGEDRAEMEAYARQQGIAPWCLFTGAIRDRETLRAWYCRSDLFLFPSTFDTSGLVVKEAAACFLPAVLIKDSGAAEGVTDGQNAFLIEENAQSLCACLLKLHGQTEFLRRIGENASREIYLSWEDSIEHAKQRYETVIEHYRCGGYAHRATPVDGIVRLNSEMMKVLAILTKKKDISAGLE